MTESPGRINADLGKEGEALRELAEKDGRALTYLLRQAIQWYVWARTAIDNGEGVYTKTRDDDELTRILFF
jgi:hypothetical protein